MCTIIFLPLFFALHVSATINENSLLTTTGNSEQTAKTAECVLKLSAKYFVEKKALSGSIVIININSYTSTTQVLLFQTIHSGIKYSVMVKDSFYPHANASHFPEKAKNYMLILEETSELTRNILQLNKLPTWNPLAKAIVFYQLNKTEDREETAIQFINELRHYKLFKSIIFIYSPEDEEVISYSWIPYSNSNCGGECTSVYVLDKCKDNVIEQVAFQIEMFPYDMKSCPLVTYAIVSEPYVLPPERRLPGTVFDDAYIFKKGGEINLVKIITQFTNMTLIMRTSVVPENWGQIYWNGSASGALDVLRNDTADLVIGNIEVTRTIRRWFNPTVSYTQDEMTWCVPRAGQASTWNNLVIIFQWSTWVATFASLLIMGLVFHYLYYRENNKRVTKWPTNSLLMTFSMLLGWGASFEPKSATFRILIFGWLCFSVNMGISYESFLRSFLMHPRFEKQISTETDLIQSRIPLGGREIYRSYFETNNASSFYLYRKYNSTTFSEGVRRAALDRNFAVVSSRRQAAYQDQKLGRGKPLIYCFPESDNLYKYGVVLLARKWFPMLERFNNIIRSVSENGLIDKWNKELLIHTVSVEGTSTIEPLGIQHLLGAFMFIGFMYTASIAVFIAEICIGVFQKWKARKNWQSLYKHIRFRNAK
uniref:Ionotropic receptor 87a n=1 Tax=Heortia vitessoides TaxID=1557813 RepID=A0A3G6V7H8_9NEOP|nr:ionotropic receptor 87a [Heortia vitessoides]